MRIDEWEDEYREMRIDECEEEDIDEDEYEPERLDRRMQVCACELEDRPMNGGSSSLSSSSSSSLCSISSSCSSSSSSLCSTHRLCSPTMIREQSSIGVHRSFTINAQRRAEPADPHQPGFQWREKIFPRRCLGSQHSTRSSWNLPWGISPTGQSSGLSLATLPANLCHHTWAHLTAYSERRLENLDSLSTFNVVNGQWSSAPSTRSGNACPF